MVPPNALQSTFGGTIDAFVTKLSSDGKSLLYSTYLGANGDDHGLGVAVDATGAAYVTGVTNSSGFPTANALQSTLSGNHDAFVTKLSSDGKSLLYSTYLGGTGDDTATAIAIDSTGAAYL